MSFRYDRSLSEYYTPKQWPSIKKRHTSLPSSFTRWPAVSKRNSISNSVKKTFARISNINLSELDYENELVKKPSYWNEYGSVHSMDGIHIEPFTPIRAGLDRMWGSRKAYDNKTRNQINANTSLAQGIGKSCEHHGLQLNKDSDSCLKFGRCDRCVFDGYGAGKSNMCISRKRDSIFQINVDTNKLYGNYEFDDCSPKQEYIVNRKQNVLEDADLLAGNVTLFDVKSKSDVTDGYNTTGESLVTSFSPNNNEKLAYTSYRVRSQGEKCWSSDSVVSTQQNQQPRSSLDAEQIHSGRCRTDHCTEQHFPITTTPLIQKSKISEGKKTKSGSLSSSENDVTCEKISNKIRRQQRVVTDVNQTLDGEESAIAKLNVTSSEPAVVVNGERMHSEHALQEIGYKDQMSSKTETHCSTYKIEKLKGLELNVSLPVHKNEDLEDILSNNESNNHPVTIQAEPRECCTAVNGIVNIGAPPKKLELDLTSQNTEAEVSDSELYHREDIYSAVDERTKNAVAETDFNETIVKVSSTSDNAINETQHYMEETCQSIEHTVETNDVAGNDVDEIIQKTNSMFVSTCIFHISGKVNADSNGVVSLNAECSKITSDSNTNDNFNNTDNADDNVINTKADSACSGFHSGNISGIHTDDLTDTDVCENISGINEVMIANKRGCEVTSKGETYDKTDKKFGETTTTYGNTHENINQHNDTMLEFTGLAIPKREAIFCSGKNGLLASGNEEVDLVFDAIQHETEKKENKEKDLMVILVVAMSAQLRAANRGRVYECVRCARSSRPIRNSYSYVRSHVQKTHLQADECPWYCVLCDFRANSREELTTHGQRFKRHQSLIDTQRRMGVLVSEDVFYRSGTKVVDLGDTNIRRYDREDSRKEYERRVVDGRRKDYKSTPVPSPEVLTSSVRELLPTPDEASEIRENFAEEGEVLRAVKIGPLKKPDEPVKPAEQEGYASDSSTSSSSSASSAASEAATRTTDVIHRLERNLVNSRDFITQCFETGQKGVDSMTAAMNSQTDAFLKMVNELQGLNNFFRNERDRREEERRQDRRKMDRRDRPY